MWFICHCRCRFRFALVKWDGERQWVIPLSGDWRDWVDITSAVQGGAYIAITSCVASHRPRAATLPVTQPSTSPQFLLISQQEYFWIIPGAWVGLQGTTALWIGLHFYLGICSVTNGKDPSAAYENLLPRVACFVLKKLTLGQYSGFHGYKGQRE